MKVSVTKTSILTKKEHTRSIEMSPEQLAEYSGVERRSIQQIFPDHSPDDREFLVSGITPEEWAAEFGEPRSLEEIQAEDAKQAELSFDKFAEDSRGNSLYVAKPNGAGGSTYMTDSIGGGAIIWDTALISPEELLVCLQHYLKEDGDKYLGRLITALLTEWRNLNPGVVTPTTL